MRVPGTLALWPTHCDDLRHLTDLRRENSRKENPLGSPIESTITGETKIHTLTDDPVLRKSYTSVSDLFMCTATFSAPAAPRNPRNPNGNGISVDFTAPFTETSFHISACAKLIPAQVRSFNCVISMLSPALFVKNTLLPSWAIKGHMVWSQRRLKNTSAFSILAVVTKQWPGFLI
ncbi:hypothetical protein Aduo_015768 [Ancylostoma duodenale]